MKKTFLVLFLFTIGSAIAGEDENAALFALGNELYARQEYDSSIAVYQQILESGYYNAPLFYNLGNAFYRTGEIGYSILYYEKALVLSPNDPDIMANLAIAEKERKDDFEEVPRAQLQLIARKVIRLASFNNWFILSLILLGLSTLLLIAFFRLKSRKKLLFAAYLSTVIFAILFSALGFSAYQLEKSSKEGVIIAPNAYMKSEPEAGKDLYIIHEGSKVRIEDHFGEWTKIRLPDGKTGWIGNNKFEEI